jgi:hypothetical protein
VNDGFGALRFAGKESVNAPLKCVLKVSPTPE